MNKLILYTLLLLFLINGKINSKENVLKNIIKSSKSMKTDENFEKDMNINENDVHNEGIPQLYNNIRRSKND